MKFKQTCLAVGVVLLALGAAGCKFNTDEKKLPEGEGYDIFLLIGGSNMAGRGPMEGSDGTRIIPGVWLLDGRDRPALAKNPLNRYSTIRMDLSVQHIGPGTVFSEKVATQAGRNVLIVVNARGGTSIEQWLPDASGLSIGDDGVGEGLVPFEEAVRRTKEAMKYGTLRGILWHQGEENANTDEQIEAYPAQLSALVDALRASFDNPSLPFFAGELPRQLGENADRFNAMLNEIGNTIPGAYCVSAAGAESKPGNDRHFSRAGQLILGENYADKVLQVCAPYAN